MLCVQHCAHAIVQQCARIVVQQYAHIIVHQYAHTGWFKLNDGNYLPYECGLHYLLEWHIFSIMLTAMNSRRG